MSGAPASSGDRSARADLAAVAASGAPWNARLRDLPSSRSPRAAAVLMLFGVLDALAQELSNARDFSLRKERRLVAQLHKSIATLAGRGEPVAEEDIIGGDDEEALAHNGRGFLQ